MRCSRSSSSKFLKQPENDKLESKLTVGTWNARTLYQAGKLELLRKELDRVRYDIVRISEVQWTGTGQQLGGRLIYTAEASVHQRGVAFILSEKAHRALIEYTPISARVITARFRAKPKTFQ